MSTVFSPGIPYTPGQAGPSERGLIEVQQPLIRLPQQGKDFTRYDGVAGQAVLFEAVGRTSNLLFARVLGPRGSWAYLYIGQGDLDAVIQPVNFETSTVNGEQDEASWARPGLPVYDQWSIAIFWTRPVVWGMGTAKVYLQEVR